MVGKPEWRNWQTQETQNLPPVTRRVGSIPSSGTKTTESGFRNDSVRLLTSAIFIVSSD